MGPQPRALLTDDFTLWDQVEFRKSYDDRKGKDRAEDVTGGAPEDRGGYGGGGGGGGGYGGDRGRY